MAIGLYANYTATRIGNQILLDIHIYFSGTPLTNNGFQINTTGYAAIGTAIANAGGGNINETDYVPGTAMVIPDNNYTARVYGHAVFNSLNQTIDITFPPWECNNNAKVIARFVLIGG